MGIRQNPTKAGIVGTLEEYRFSSYRGYMHGGTLTDTTFLWDCWEEMNG